MKNLLIILLLSFGTLQAQEKQYNFAHPLKIPISLNASFGELRNNHFHSGIDYATQQAEGKNVYSIDDGYVARIAVSPVGFGRALYIAHPKTGLTSVYGHLQGFTAEIDSIVKNYQYENRQSQVDFQLDEKQIPVKRDQLIGKSGNSGSSGGPHLHFEVRDTKSEEIINPLHFGFGIEDTRKPTIRAIAVYPVEGVVNGRTSRLTVETIPELGATRFKTPTAITAWGKIGLAVKAYDAIDNSIKTLGVNEIRLFVDEQLVSMYKINRFAFDESRFINSFIDFDDWKRHRSFFMKSFVEPNNQLRLFKIGAERGYINISEERDYKIHYEVFDTYGNKASLAFVIRGKKAAVPSKPECEEKLLYNQQNIVQKADFKAVMPQNVLYDDLCLDYKRTPSKTYLSDIHYLQDSYTPLHDYIDISLPYDAHKIADTSKLLAIKTNGTQHPIVLGGTWENGQMNFKTREFGAFAVMIDTIPPKITPQPKAPLRFKISDNLSGIDTYNGYIDGVWALFEYDAKTRSLFHRPDRRVRLLKPYKLRLEVTDKVGNKAVYENTVR
ncbi:MAG: M23 family metallopeptidase [Prevotellaceae bacterium]|jgi:murein DD-endopeptidase MepM/ murein hydrolase activator NlpD|nr:M23 family metallopeptidase [Prevotellaceae bacterium]